MVPERDLQAAWPSEPAGPAPPARRRLGFMKELPFLVAAAFALALLMKTFLVQMFYIPSESMVPTLLVQDRVAVNKLAYRFREPRRGEVIVFIAHPNSTERTFLRKVRDFLTDGLGVTRPPEDDFIKRIIGLPGETIEVTKRNVFITTVDGERLKLNEPYINDQTENFRTFGPFEIGPDEFFVMGDNRNNSSDSRSSLGPIPRDRIIGKAFVKIWPVRRIGTMPGAGYDDAVPRPAGRAAPAAATGVAAFSFAMVAGLQRRAR